MEAWSVKLQQIKKTAEEEKSYSGQLEGWSGDIGDIRRKINFRVAGREQLLSRLAELSAKAAEEGKGMRTLSERLDEIAQTYRVSENKIYYHVLTKQLPDWIPDSVLDMLEWAGVIVGEVTSGNSGFEGETTIGNSHISITPDSETEDYLVEHGGRERWEEKGYIDQDGKEHKEKYDFDMDELASVNLWDSSVEGSIYSEEWQSAGENWSAEGEVHVGKGEIYSKAYGGLFSVDENGEKHFTPGFGAEVGMGVTAFEAAGEVLYGDDMWGAYTKGELTALSAEAKAEAKAGLYDENGNFNPQLKMGASAEAILAEASIAGGINLAGASIEGSASVNFGVGAHADIGYSDGVFSFDVGASLGIGVSVDIDIDVGGMVDAVTEAADAVASAAEAVWDWLW